MCTYYNIGMLFKTLHLLAIHLQVQLDTMDLLLLYLIYFSTIIYTGFSIIYLIFKTI